MACLLNAAWAVVGPSGICKWEGLLLLPVLLLLLHALIKFVRRELSDDSHCIQLLFTL